LCSLRLETLEVVSAFAAALRDRHESVEAEAPGTGASGRGRTAAAAPLKWSGWQLRAASFARTRSEAGQLTFKTSPPAACPPARRRCWP
jgi:hypothetical protein